MSRDHFFAFQNTRQGFRVHPHAFLVLVANPSFDNSIVIVFIRFFAAWGQFRFKDKVTMFVSNFLHNFELVGSPSIESGGTYFGDMSAHTTVNA